MKNLQLRIAFLVVFGCAILCAQTLSDRDIELAERYIVLNKYTDAKEILERLQISYPTNERVLTGLRKVYFALKEYDKLTAILNTELLQNPRSIELNMELGKLYLATGKPQDAKTYFTKAVRLSGDPIKTYVDISDAYLNWGYIDDGIAFILAGRQELHDDFVFGSILGDFYAIKGDIKKAMDEYLKYIMKNPSQQDVVLEKFREFGKNDSDLVLLKTTIMSYLGKSKNDQFLAQLLYQTETRLGDLEGAFESLKKLEIIAPDSGKRIAEFGFSLCDRKEYKLAERVSDYLVATYGKGSYGLMGSLIRGLAMRGDGKIAEAISTFEELAMMYEKGKPGTIETDIGAKGKLELARTYFNLQGNANKAIEILTPVVKDTKIRSSTFRDSALLLADAYVKVGRINDAVNLLTALSSALPQDEFIIFRLGEIYLFSGEFDKGKTLLTNLTLRFPKSLYLNDALEYLLALSFPEGKEAIKALIGTRMGDPEQSLNQLEKLEKGEIKDFVLWKEALILVGLNKKNKALEKLSSLADSLPQSFYAPLAFELRGDIFAERGEFKSAATEYNNVLKNYPNAINIDEVRRKIRALPGNI